MKRILAVALFISMPASARTQSDVAAPTRAAGVKSKVRSDTRSGSSGTELASGKATVVPAENAPTKSASGRPGAKQPSTNAPAKSLGVSKDYLLADGTPRYRFVIKVFNQSGRSHTDPKFRGWFQESERNANIIFAPCGVRTDFQLVEDNAAVEVIQEEDKNYAEYLIKGERRKLVAETSGDQRHGFINVYVVKAMGSIGRTFPEASKSAMWVVLDYRASNPAVYPGGNVAHELGHLAGLKHPWEESANWPSAARPRDNFMTDGVRGTLPNRHIATVAVGGLESQCVKIRKHAVDLGANH